MEPINKKSDDPNQGADPALDLSGPTLYEQVHLAKQEWESTADSLQQIVCLVDSQGHIQRINRSVERWGLGDVAVSPGRHFHELFHPGCSDPACYLERLWQRAQEQITSGQPVHHEGYDSRLARHVNIQIQPFTTAAHRDKLIGDHFATLLIEDITRRIEMERQQALEHEVLEKRNRQLQALNRAALVFGSTLDFDQLLLAVINETLMLLEATATSVWLLDESSQELTCRQATGPANKLLYGWKLPVGKGLVGWVAQHNQSLIVGDAQADERHFAAVDEQTGFAMRSILSVPLCVRKRLIGVLQAVDPQPEHFDESHLTFLESLATFAAIAIENAQLSEQAQQEITSRQWVERALQWELSVNIALAELSHVLLSTEFSIQQIAELTLQYARQLTCSEHGFVSVIDPKTGDNLAYTLTKMIADGRCEINAEEQRIAFRLGVDGRYSGLWGQALNTRQAFFTNLPTRHPASSGVPQGHVPLQNYLAAPALIGDQPVGEIALANSAEGYTEHHLEAVRRLADIFALAIQRLHAEQALRESRLRWQSLVDSAPVAIYETDAQGNYIYANQRWLEHAGLSIEQATGASWAQALHPDDRGPINSSWYAAVREGREWNLEYRFCTPERKITWVQGTAIALRDVLGQVTGFLGSNVDITARKLAESESEQRNKELLTLFRISQFALIEQQIDDLYRAIAAEISAATGFPIVAIEEYDPARQVMVFRGSVGIDIPAGKMFEVPVDQTPSGQVARSGQMLVETAAEQLAGEVDERLRPLNVKTFLCFPMIAGQQPKGVISLAHPLKVSVEERLLRWTASLANYTAAVVQRQESTLALERHARQLEAINAIATASQSAYSLQDTIQIVLEKTLEITAMDGGWLHLLDPDGENLSLLAHQGISAETALKIKTANIHRYLIGRIASSSRTILIPDATVDSSLDAEITQSEGRKTVTGTPIWVKDKLIATFTLFSRSPRMLTQHDANLLTAIGNQVGLIIENTHLAEQAAEVDILRQVDHLRSELLANVSHEIRTPLGLIKIFATTLLRPDVSIDAQTLQEFLGNIDEETTRLEEIVENLLLSSRLEAGSRQLDLQSVDLNELIHKISQEVLACGVWHHIELELPEQPIQAVADISALGQVLHNLLNNAVKYSPEGSTIIIGMRPEPGQAVLWVRDFGIGIPPEEAARIFERFYRADNAITRKVRGAGLGLPISQKLVELHGGYMWVESQPGSGSTFYFSLPL